MARSLPPTGCENVGMTFKTGFVVGAAVGYVLGAKAGRERYEQIVVAFQRLMGNERVQSVTDKGKAYVDSASERVRTTVGDAIHTASDKLRPGHDEVAAS